MKKKKGFTLVELLAVIVILAIILVIAVPKIMDTIQNAKEGTLMSSAKLIAGQAEKKYVENQVLGITDKIECSDIVKTSDADYDTCDIKFDSDGKASVTISGKGKFEGMAVCGGTKTDATISEGCYTDEACFTYTTTVGAYSIDYDKCIEYFENESNFNPIDITNYCMGGKGGLGGAKNTLRDDINSEIISVNELKIEGIISNVSDELGVKITNYNRNCGSNVWIPNTIDNKKVYVIGRDAFNGYDEDIEITNLKLPNTIVEIKEFAFAENYNLTSNLNMSELTDLMWIGYGAFTSNSISGELDLSNSTKLKITDEHAFSYNNISKVKLPRSIVNLGGSLFEGNSLSGHLNLNDLTNLHTISYGVFSNNQITSVSIPANVTIIGSNAFYNNTYDEATDSYSNLLTNVTLGNVDAEVYCEAFGDPSEIETHNLPNSYINEWICEDIAE